MPSLSGSSSATAKNKSANDSNINPNLGINGQHGFSLNINSKPTIEPANFGFSKTLWIIAGVLGLVLLVLFIKK